MSNVERRALLLVIAAALCLAGCEAIPMGIASSDANAGIPAADLMPNESGAGAKALAEFGAAVMLHEESDGLLVEARGASKATAAQRREAEAQSAELWKQAVKRYEATLAADAKCVAACQRLSSGYFDRNDGEQGLLWLKRAAELNPGDFGVLFSLGVQNERAGRAADAIDAYARAERARPEGDEQGRFVPVVVFELARLLEQQNKPSEAAAAWERFLKLKPLGDEAYQGNRTLLDIRDLMKNHAPVLEKIAELYVKIGKPDQAVAAWRDAYKAQPDFPQALLRIAELRRDTGNLPAAVEVCKEYIEKEPGRLDGMTLLVELYKAQGKAGEAVDAAQAFLKEKPFLYQLHYLLGTLYEQRSEPDKALAEYRIIMRDGRAYAPAYLRAADLESKGGKPEKALAVFALGVSAGVDDDAFYDELDRRIGEAGKAGDLLDRFRIAVVPEDQKFGFYYVLGRMAQELKKPAEAEAAFREALRQKPDYPQAVIRLAGVLIGEGKPKDAAALLREAAAKDAKNMLLWRFLADAESTAGNPAGAVTAMKHCLSLNPANAENAALLVSFMGDAGQLDAAESFLEGKIAESSDNSERWSALLAEFLMEHDRKLDRAVDVLQSELGDDPENADLLTLLGRVHLKQKDYAGAAEAFRRAAKLDPGNLMARTLVAEALEEGKNLDGAEKELRDALAEKPGNSGLQTELGRFLVRTKRAPEEGLALLRTVVVAEPDDPGARLAVASALTFLKRHDEALAELRKIVEKFPDYLPARYSLAMAFDATKDFPKAEAELKGILAKDPSEHMAANALGYMYADRSIHLDEALKLVEGALDKEPNNGAYLDSYGWIFFRKGDLPRALEYLSKAFDKARDAVIAEHLGDVCWKMGRKTDALTHYQEARTLDKEGETSAVKKVEAIQAGRDPLAVTK